MTIPEIDHLYDGIVALTVLQMILTVAIYRGFSTDHEVDFTNGAACGQPCITTRTGR